jgi:putative nucleotidyltransferase with HDIG domain
MSADDRPREQLAPAPQASGDSDRARRALLSLLEDERRSHDKLLRVIRALKTLSACNSAVVHATSEMQLLREMCEVLIRVGGYMAAWVGYAEPDAGKTVRPVAWAGLGEQYVVGLKVSWADTESGRGPTGRCIRTGQPQVSHNYAVDPSVAPWLDKISQYGFRSGAALPLADSNGTYGALNVYAKEINAFDADELALLAEMAGDLAFGISSVRSGDAQRHAEDKLHRALVATVEAIAATIEMRDPYTAGHQRRVAELASAIATEMKLAPHIVEGVRFGALIHDLGKVRVPAELLAKPTRLSKAEFELIKTHAQAGYDLVKGIDFPWPVAQMVHQHHERLDGTGYPQGLKDGEIAIEARILGVADVVEAMSSRRPYREGPGIAAALKEVEDHRATLFDAAAVDACLRMFREQRFAFVGAGREA